MSAWEDSRSTREHKNRFTYGVAPWVMGLQLLVALLLATVLGEQGRAASSWFSWLLPLLLIDLAWIYLITRFHNAGQTGQGSRRWRRYHLIIAMSTTLVWASAPLVFVTRSGADTDTLVVLLLLIAASAQLLLHLHSSWGGMFAIALPPLVLALFLLSSYHALPQPQTSAIIALYGGMLLWLQRLLRRLAVNKAVLESESDELRCERYKARTLFAHARELTGIAYWELDLKSGVLTWSNDAYALFGLPNGTPLSGQAVMGAIYWEDRNYYQRTLREALTGKGPLHREFRVVHPDGSIRVLRDSGEIISNTEGEKLLMLGVMHDVTTEVDAAEKLHSAYNELSRILDHMQDTYFRADPSGRLSTVSASINTLLGFTPEECIGKSITDLYVSSRHGHTFLIDLNTQGGTLRNYQIQMHRSDGQSVWVSINAKFICNDKEKVIGIEGTIRDITQLRQTEHALHKERERALVTLHSIADGVITTNSEGDIQYLNPTAEKLLGIKTADVAGHSYLQVLRLIDEESGESIGDIVRHCLYNDSKGSYTYQGLLITTTGEHYHLNIHASPIRDLLGDVMGAVLVIHDVTEVMGMAKQLNYQANHDALTGLFNRRVFEKRVDEAIRYAQQRDEHHALLYIDLDQFKVVNDTCGHRAGDELLQQVGALMQQQVRESDILARLGGDEFGVLLEYCPLENAKKIAEGIHHSIRDYRFCWDDKTFEIGASIGLVPIIAESGNLSEILSAADAACYVAKDSGRNRIHIYQADDAAVAKRHGEMEWVHRLNHAIEQQHFILYGQAVAHVAGDRVISHYEILLRMADESGRIIPPGAFIPAAERYNLMPAIDRWVIRKTMEMVRDAQGELAFPPIECAINLSGQSLCDEHFLEYVVDLFEETGIPCESICFEITETAAVANLSRATRFISVLKNMGCSFALDDFGSGLSSFGYLKRLPIDYLKIDGSFVRDMVIDQVDRAMVESINQIGHVMKLKTIAEFAEDEGVLMALERAGVDYAQGYGIGAPIPLEKILKDELRQLGNRDDVDDVLDDEETVAPAS